MSDENIPLIIGLPVAFMLLLLLLLLILLIVLIYRKRKRKTAGQGGSGDTEELDNQDTGYSRDIPDSPAGYANAGEYNRRLPDSYVGNSPL